MRRAIASENPLVEPLAQLLRVAVTPLSEYQLIRQLVDEGIWVDGYQGSSLGVFRTHFYVMNALYQLREQFRLESVHLHISPLAIYLEPGDLESVSADADAHLSRQPSAVDPLSAYYLDWGHLESATEASVDALLADFWRRWVSQDKGSEARGRALAILELGPDADEASIRQAYRRLAMQHHPDRGGDPQAFIRLQQAIEHLLPR